GAQRRGRGPLADCGGSAGTHFQAGGGNRRQSRKTASGSATFSRAPVPSGRASDLARIGKDAKWRIAERATEPVPGTLLFRFGGVSADKAGADWRYHILPGIGACGF